MRVLVSWSSGKDSAWTLHLLRQMPQVEVVGLLTTFNTAFDRVAMHAVRRSLVEAQAVAARLPLWAVPLPWPCSNADYEKSMAQVFRRAVEQGIDSIAFGDLFLADVRAYREAQLSQIGGRLVPVFPLWMKPTLELAEEMIASGLRARLTCIDPEILPADFAGREFDRALLADLPPGVDPCGEKGEFHSFVYAGPMFNKNISVEVGEICRRDGFVFADLVDPAARLPHPSRQSPADAAKL
jgi:uncharacterized protein (TIGR00290 family)